MDNKLFFGFALADSMFGDGTITRRTLDTTSDELEDLLTVADGMGELVPCLNPSHKATIKALADRYGIHMQIPNAPPRVKLEDGDRIIVMGVRGLPRLTDRHEYTEAEIASATFQFTLYTYWKST